MVRVSRICHVAGTHAAYYITTSVYVVLWLLRVLFSRFWTILYVTTVGNHMVCIMQYFKCSHSVCYSHIAVCRLMYDYLFHRRKSIATCTCMVFFQRALILQIMLANCWYAWRIQQNHEAASTFEKKLVALLKECMVKARSSSSKIHSDQIWSAYHSLRTSDCNWECVTLKADIQAPSGSN